MGKVHKTAYSAAAEAQQAAAYAAFQNELQTRAKKRERDKARAHPDNCPNCGALWEPVCSYCKRGAA